MILRRGLRRTSDPASLTTTRRELHDVRRRNQRPVTLHGAIDLPAYPGIDARYAYCQTSKRTDSTFVSCLAFVARGSLVSSVWTVHGSSRGDNSSGVKQVAAIAAEALRKAP